MRIKINGNSFDIKSISNLSFNEFNKILIEGKVASLDEYLALFTEIPIDQLLKSKIKGVTIEAVHKFIFNIDIEKQLKEHKDTVTHRDMVYLVEKLELETFGKAYYYDLYFQRYKANQINHYQLCMYALAIALSPTLDDNIEQIYNELSLEKWTEFLPVAFFLAKKYRKPRTDSIKLLIACTLGLKMIKWRTYLLKKKLTLQAKT